MENLLILVFWGAICQFVHQIQLPRAQDCLQNQVAFLKPFGVLRCFKLAKSRPLSVKD